MVSISKCYFRALRWAFPRFLEISPPRNLRFRNNPAVEKKAPTVGVGISGYRNFRERMALSMKG